MRTSASTLVWWNQEAIISWRDGRFSRIPVERRRTITGRSYDSDTIRVEYGSTGIDNLILSPDGQSVAWSISTVDGYVKEETGRDSITFKIWKSDLAGERREMIYSLSYKVNDVDVDHGLTWNLLRWSQTDPSIVFLVSEESFQLDSPNYKYTSLNVRNGSTDSLGYEGEILEISQDEQSYLSTQYLGCCATGDYEVWIGHLRKGKTDLYRWSEEGGVDKPVGREAGFFTDGAFFSPDGSYVATNTRTPEINKVIIWSRAGDKVLEFNDRAAFGWIGPKQILVGVPFGKKDIYNGAYVSSLDGAPEVRLISGEVAIIGPG